LGIQLAGDESPFNNFLCLLLADTEGNLVVLSTKVSNVFPPNSTIPHSHVGLANLFSSLDDHFHYSTGPMYCFDCLADLSPVTTLFAKQLMALSWCDEPITPISAADIPGVYITLLFHFRPPDRNSEQSYSAVEAAATVRVNLSFEESVVEETMPAHGPGGKETDLWDVFITLDSFCKIGSLLCDRRKSQALRTHENLGAILH
jgi:hypothetical protein